MRTFVGTALLTALLAAAATLVGRLAAAAFGVRMLRRPGPESLLVSAFVGTGVLLLAYGWGSYLGLPAPWCLPVVGGAVAVLAVAAAVRRRLGEALELPQPRLVLLGVLLCLAAPAAGYFLPLLLGQSFLPFCDASAYIGTAEWLQTHGFSTPAVADPQFPVNSTVLSFQGLSHRMGPMYLLALLRAALPGFVTAELYPVVVGWGLALNGAGVFVLCRWALRLPRFQAVCGTFLVASACNSLCLSATLGFLCQLYGTAALAFGLALLARLQSRVNWRFGAAALAALVFSTQLSVYSELSPVVAVAGLACLGRAAWRARRSGRLLRLVGFVGLAGLALAAVGNYELVRAVRGVLRISQLSGVGWHIAWTPERYAGFVLGFYPFHVFNFKPLGGTAELIAVGVAAVALLAGLVCLVGNRRALPLAAALLVFAALAAYFRFLAVDPWTGEVGHSWNLLKIAKWSFPVVAALEAAGLALLLRWVPGRRVLLAVLCVAAVCVAAPAHHRRASDTLANLRRAAGPHSGLPDLKGLYRKLDELRPRNLYFAHAPTGPWPRSAAAYLLYPRPFVSGWRGSRFFDSPELADDRPEEVGPDTLFFQEGDPPFEEPEERLALNYCLIDGSRPHIIGVVNPNGVERWDGRGATWVGDRECQLFVYAPRAAELTLSFEVRPGPSLPDTQERTLRLTGPDGKAREWTFTAVKDGTVECPPFKVPAGVSRVELVCPDRPARKLGKEGRVLLVGVIAARLTPAP